MIRSYSPQDADRIIEIWLKASALAQPFLEDDFLLPKADVIRKRHLPSVETYVYEKRNLVIGFICIKENEVGALFFDPDYHGHGYGRTLMDYAVALKGWIQLDVFKENTIGRRFYKSYGFLEIAEQIHKPTGQALLLLRYDKPE